MFYVPGLTNRRKLSFTDEQRSERFPTRCSNEFMRSSKTQVFQMTPSLNELLHEPFLSFSLWTHLTPSQESFFKSWTDDASESLSNEKVRRPPSFVSGAGSSDGPLGFRRNCLQLFKGWDASRSREDFLCDCWVKSTLGCCFSHL